MTISKTQARVEGINQQIVRCDIRIPVAIYSQLEAIALSEGMKPHHITGRPMVSPIILEMLEIGLRHYQTEKTHLPDTVPDTIPDTLNLESLKAELLEQLRGEIATQQQPQTLDPNIEARLDAMEAALAGK
jgi:hypothetical protein